MPSDPKDSLPSQNCPNISANKFDLARVAVVIPALNEAESLRKLLPELVRIGVGQIIVGDNDSSDATADVSMSFDADVAIARQRGYGAACHAALQLLRDDIDFIVFVNADLTDDVTLIPVLIQPILADECDLVIGARVAPLRPRGAMTLPQRFGDRLATMLIELSGGYRYYDLGPFRAIRRASLDAINMQDRGFGWTIEMQMRALQLSLRIQQLPVPYFRSPTPSHISGTVVGVLRAANGILGTWWRCRKPPHSARSI